ncbi:MAG: GNAT family N-acetyltransferase [Thiotrichales bacterium]
MKVGESIEYVTGIPEHFRDAAVTLYDDAFASKLGLAVKNTEHRRSLFRAGFALEFGIAAIAGDQLVGIAGFQTAEGSLTGGISYADLVKHLGWFKGSRAALLFLLYERRPEPGELLMDGIAVHSDVRGQGVGSSLLAEIRRYARRYDYERIRLDVVDTNPRAKKLYERIGFRVTKTEQFPWLGRFLGFKKVSTMGLAVRD